MRQGTQASVGVAGKFCAPQAPTVPVTRVNHKRPPANHNCGSGDSGCGRLSCHWVGGLVSRIVVCTRFWAVPSSLVIGHSVREIVGWNRGVETGQSVTLVGFLLTSLLAVGVKYWNKLGSR